MKENELIAEFMGLPKQGNTYEEPYSGEYVEAIELSYDESWDWLMPVVEKINTMKDYKYSVSINYHYTTITDNQVTEIIMDEDTDTDTRSGCYNAVVKFIKQYNTEQLQEWARVNLLPQENTDTRLRFAEGIEDYDEDYIKEMYNAKNK